MAEAKQAALNGKKISPTRGHLNSRPLRLLEFDQWEACIPLTSAISHLRPRLRLLASKHMYMPTYIILSLPSIRPKPVAQDREVHSRDDFCTGAKRTPDSILPSSFELLAHRLGDADRTYRRRASELEKSRGSIAVGPLSSVNDSLFTVCPAPFKIISSVTLMLHTCSRCNRYVPLIAHRR